MGRGQVRSGEVFRCLPTVCIEVWRRAHRRGCYSSTWLRHTLIDPRTVTRVTAPCEGDGDGGAGHPSSRRHIVKAEATRNEGKSRQDAPYAAITEPLHLASLESTSDSPQKEI